MNGTSLEALRTRLDRKTLEWLRANPGSLLVPRSVIEALHGASDQQVPLGALTGTTSPYSPR
jgi:hypothetical protein